MLVELAIEELDEFEEVFVLFTIVLAAGVVEGVGDAGVDGDDTTEGLLTITLKTYVTEM